MSIPVYIFTGFLDSGKTAFVQETLEDSGFCTGEKTLLLLCEEGENEYNPAKFAGGNVTILPIENEADFTQERLKKYQKEHRIDRVLIEYNGMWPMTTLYDALPNSWEIFQIINLADSTTFASYLQNMRQLTVDKLQDPEMVIFNRCTEQTDKALLHRSVRMVNRRSAMAFERTDGSVDADDIVDELPFDKTADCITIADADFGLWYLDAMDNLKDYIGKTVAFKGFVCQTPRVPKGCFVPGRFGMTCCVEDIAFIGFICEAENAAALPHKTWVDVVAKVSAKEHPIYEGKGPWLKAIRITPSAPPAEELVYFIR
ncbi:MAG: GTP-binding protein [Ruthenibacterium sp.]